MTYYETNRNMIHSQQTLHHQSESNFPSKLQDFTGGLQRIRKIHADLDAHGPDLDGNGIRQILHQQYRQTQGSVQRNDLPWRSVETTVDCF